MKVTVEGDRVRIENMRITDPELIKWLKAQPDLEAALSEVLNTGVAMMQGRHGQGSRFRE
jgi:hypothetical protein